MLFLGSNDLLLLNDCISPTKKKFLNWKHDFATFQILTYFKQKLALTDENLRIEEKLLGQFEQVRTIPFNTFLIKVSILQILNIDCSVSKIYNRDLVMIDTYMLLQ